MPATVLTAVSWLLIAFSFWLVMLGFDLGVGFEAGVLVVVATNLAMILPSGPAAVGVFEAATIVALAPFGVDRTVALSYGIVVHALNALPYIPAGYIALHYHAAAVRDRSTQGTRAGGFQRADARRSGRLLAQITASRLEDEAERLGRHRNAGASAPASQRSRAASSSGCHAGPSERSLVRSKFAAIRTATIATVAPSARRPACPPACETCRSTSAAPPREGGSART